MECYIGLGLITLTQSFFPQFETNLCCQRCSIYCKQLSSDSPNEFFLNSGHTSSSPVCLTHLFCNRFQARDWEETDQHNKNIQTHCGSDTPETRNTRGKAWDRPGRVEPSEPVLRFGTSWNTLFRFWPGFSVGKQVAEDRNKVRPSPKLLLSIVQSSPGLNNKNDWVWDTFFFLVGWQKCHLSYSLSAAASVYLAFADEQTPWNWNSADLDVNVI